MAGARSASAADAKATAAPPLAQLQLPAGSLRVEADGRVALVTATDAPVVARLAPPPASARLRLVADGLVEIVGTSGSRGRVALLRVASGRAELLFDEATGPNADGELTRFVEVGPAGATRWQATPAVARCDARPPLFSQRFDPATKAWSPLATPVPSAPVLTAVATLDLPPPRRALRFASASRDGDSDSADRLGAPRELDDGNPQSAWRIGPAATSAGAFATARAPREVTLVGLRIAPPPSPARLPAAVVLIGGTPARALYRLPLDGARAFRLPSPLKGACVSFVVDDKGRGELAIGEIELLAADDGTGGLAALARAVATDENDAEGSAHGLQGAGVAGVDAALAALPSASRSGRVRLLEVVASQARLLGQAHLRVLGVALETAHGDERRVLVDAIAAQPAAALAVAARLLSDPSQSGEARADAITLLARVASTSVEAATLLFDRLPTADRALARRALQVAAARTPQIALDAAKLLPAATTTHADLVAVIGAVTSATLPPGDRATLLLAIDAIGPVEKQPFELAVRLLGAFGVLGGPSLYAAVGQVLAHAHDPTLRLVAVKSLPLGSDPAVGMLLRTGVADPDARVREEALTRLLTGRRDPTLAGLLVARSDDGWPQVRRVAYEGLGAACDADASALLERRVFGRAADLDGRARAAALVALSHCPSGTLEKIASAISVKQPHEVRERAAQLLGDLGDPAAAPLVVKALDRAFSHGGPELIDAAVVLLRTLGRLGARRGSTPFDDDALTVLRDAAADPFYPVVRIAAMEALSTGCPDGAKVVFDRGEKDPEPAVQRAAALARGRCPR